MHNSLKEALWKQFGASIDMLKNIITLCPDDFFANNKKFFYTTYHSLVFLDYYLSIPPKNFSSPLPFTLKEPGEIPADAIDDVIPDSFYTQQELLGYLQASREKCHALIMGLTDERLEERFIEELEEGAMNYSILEILLYNMRHVQHHVGQLNSVLRQHINDAAGWVARAGD